MIMVRGNELACRNEWASDLWEQAESGGASKPKVAAPLDWHPRKREPEATPHEIAALLTAQTTVAAPVANAADVQEDVVLGETQVVGQSLNTRQWLTADDRGNLIDEFHESSAHATPQPASSADGEVQPPRPMASVGDLYGSHEQPSQSSRLSSGAAADREDVVAARDASHETDSVAMRQRGTQSEATGFQQRLQSASDDRDSGRETARRAARVRQQSERQTEQIFVSSRAELHHRNSERGDETSLSTDQPRSLFSHQPTMERSYNQGARSSQPEASEVAAADHETSEPSTRQSFEQRIFRDDPSPVPVAEAARIHGQFTGDASELSSSRYPMEDEQRIVIDEELSGEAILTDEVVESTVRLDLDAYTDDEPLLPASIDVAPQLARVCGTCRDFRPAEGGERGWCANRWAFTHRRMVDANDDMPCATILGGWWLPVDEVWLENADVSSHGQPTPLMDALFNPHREERIRRGGA